jgi:hypothetical protein
MPPDRTFFLSNPELQIKADANPLTVTKSLNFSPQHNITFARLNPNQRHYLWMRLIAQ